MSLFGHSGSAPVPFDACDGPRLAGPEGSHPLHRIEPGELVSPGRGGIAGSIELEPGVVRVGGTVRGRIRVRATEGIDARGAALRLVGLKLCERAMSTETRDKDGRVTSRDAWVEARGELFETTGFTEPAIPARLAAGETWEGAFAIPAPPLGPPEAHLGEAIVAWALEARWDVAFGPDAGLAVHLPVEQHPDLQRAGVGRQGGESLLAEVSDDGALLAIESPLPAPAGSALVVAVRWPDAPESGRGGRIELHRRSDAPNAAESIVASAEVAVEAFRDGSARVALPIPADASPSFDGAGLELRYVLRALVDVPMLPDRAVERPVGVSG